MPRLAIDVPDSLGRFERPLVALILFYAAVVFCLPVPHSEEIATAYPWWAKRIAVGNIQLHEVLMLGWLALYGRRFALRALLNVGMPTRQAAIWLIAMALWCGLISLSAPLPGLDLGRTFRLLLNAVLMLAVVRWTRQTGNFPLSMLVLGFFTGTIINLVLSFQYPLIVYGTMRLSGQNTPGVAMGIAIHLSAWLFFRACRRTMQVFAVASAMVFAFGCAISYSRIGWFGGGLGMIAWAYVLIAAAPSGLIQRERLKEARRVLAPIFAFALVSLLTVPLGQDGVDWIKTLAEQKFSNADDSDTTRWAYVIGTAEILSRQPLGVGYSGFFDAMTTTEIYRSGQAGEEDSPVEANPHATFLWYFTAGGIPGGAMALMVFVMLLNSTRRGLISAMGRAGMILFLLAAPSFLLIGLTVPYLFNSIILVVPAAIAAGWGWTQRAKQTATSGYANAKKDLRSEKRFPAVS
jgi:hypothetical protein